MSGTVQDGTVRLEVVDAKGKTVHSFKSFDGSVHEDAPSSDEKTAPASSETKASTTTSAKPVKNLAK